MVSPEHMSIQLHRVIVTLLGLHRPGDLQKVGLGVDAGVRVPH